MITGTLRYQVIANKQRVARTLLSGPATDTTFLRVRWSGDPLTDSLNRTLWPPEGGGFVTSFFMLKILEESFTIPDVRFLINF